MAKSKAQLTDDEGTFLALVAQIEPATAYQLSKVYEDSPVSNFGTSKGKIYPLIRRLKERGLIRTKPVKDDARGTEMLMCTAAGERAVKQWVTEIRPNHLLLDDPLRTKVQSFELLSSDERRSWISTARKSLNEKLEHLESYGQEVTVPFKDYVHDNAVASIRSRLKWLDRLEAGLFRQPKG